MRKEVFVKAVLTGFMVGWYLWMPVMGYCGEAGCCGTAAYGTVLAHLLYMWSHANVWHLLGNLFVLWVWRGRLFVMPSLVLAVLCSWLPVVPGVWEVVGEPAADATGTVVSSAGEPLSTVASVTVGFSGVLFGMAGIRWGVYCRRLAFRRTAFWEFCVKALPFALLGAFIPHINWCIHLYCMVAGFACGLCWPVTEVTGTERKARN